LGAPGTKAGADRQYETIRMAGRALGPWGRLRGKKEGDRPDLLICDLAIKCQVAPGEVVE